MSNCGFRVTAIDKIEGYWTSGFFNRHYRIISDDITNPQIEGQYEMITCVSVLEHIPEHDAAIAGMCRLLKPSGHLLLTFPYNENKYIDNVYKLPEASYGHDAPFICQVYSRKQMDKWLKDNDLDIVGQEYWQVFSGEFWTFGQRVYPPRRVSANDNCQLTCILLKKGE